MINIKTFFMTIFLLGSFIIFIGNMLNYTYVPLVLTIVIMIVYYVVTAISLNKVKSISYEQFADSNYYLGFLFTLVSLSVTLVSLSQNNNMEMLISQFGIAILTTLVGLSLRIYTVNFIPNEEVNRESFDFIISQKLQMIDNQITQTIDRNKLFSDTLDEKINIFQEKTEHNMNEFSNKLLVNLDITKLSDIIENISRSMMDGYDKQSIILEKLVNEIKKVNGNYVDNVENVNNSISKNHNFLDIFITSIDKIKEKLENYTEKINDTTNHYNSNIQNLNELFTNQINKTDNNQKNLVLELSKGIETIKNENSIVLFNFLEKMSTSESKYIDSNNELNKITNTFVQKSEINNEKLIDSLESIKNELGIIKESSNHLHTFESKYIDSNNELNKITNTFIQNHELTNEKLIDSLESIKNELSIIKESSNHLHTLENINILLSSKNQIINDNDGIIFNDEIKK